VTSQISDSIRKRLMSRGVRLGVDFVLRSWSKPYVSRKLSLEYIKTIFVPYLNELRDWEEFEACEAVFLMDNCLPHISDDFVAVLIYAWVRIITFAPHTTHIFQMLDMVLFCTLKKHANRLKKFGEERPAPHPCSRSLTTSNKSWLKWIHSVHLQSSDSLAISSKVT
jgi:hypothetical protein